MTDYSNNECITVQHSILGDPAHIDSATQQHLQSCERCQQFASDATALNSNIHATLHINVPGHLDDKILLAKGIRTRRRPHKLSHWLKTSIAASIVAATSIGSYLHFSAPLLLEQLALEHVRDELHHLADRNNVQLDRLNAKFRPLQMKLAQSSYTIHYAGSCKIADTDGLHVVLAGQHAPVTLLFMPSQQINSRRTLQDGTFKTVVLPLKRGSVAIIGDRQETLDAYERQIREHLIIS